MLQLNFMPKNRSHWQFWNDAVLYSHNIMLCEHSFNNNNIIWFPVQLNNILNFLQRHCLPFLLIYCRQICCWGPKLKGFACISSTCWSISVILASLLPFLSITDLLSLLCLCSCWRLSLLCPLSKRFPAGLRKCSAWELYRQQILSGFCANETLGL